MRIQKGQRHPFVGEARRKLQVPVPAGPAAYTLDDDVEKALRDFQETQGLPVTGEIDDATLAALRPS